MSMKALVFSESGINNLRVREVNSPKIGPGGVLVRVAMAAANPVDFESVNARDASPVPHIPGAEFAGTVEKVGRKVSNVRPGDRVAVYPRIYCGKCALCTADMEMMCAPGGNRMIGWDTNGGYAELAAVPGQNVFRIPDEISWEMAASLPVAALTAYHAVGSAGLKRGDTAVIFAASGNTGMFASQFANESGARVIAVSRRRWLTRGFGVRDLIDWGKTEAEVRRLTRGRMADAVIDPVGADSLDTALSLVNHRGRVMVFGALKSYEAEINILNLFRKEARIMGVTGGSIREFRELIGKAHRYNVRVWKTFTLEDGKKALLSLHSKERDGRVLIKVG